MMKRIALTVVFLMFWDLSAVFAFQFPVLELYSKFMETIYKEVETWDWPKNNQIFSYGQVFDGNSISLYVAYSLSDGSIKMEQIDKIELEKITLQNYNKLALEAIKETRLLFTKAKSMNENGKLRLEESFIELSEKESELYGKLLLAGKNLSVRKFFLQQIDKDFVKLDQIYGFFDGKRNVRVRVVFVNKCGLEDYHVIENISFSELNSFKTENDFLIFAGIVYDKAEIFLTSRKIKINNIATNIAN